MKKYLFFIMLILFPLHVFAVSNVDYEISAYKVEAEVKENGNVDVCEYIKQTGSFNGYVRDIFYKDGDSLYIPKNLSNLFIYDLNITNMSKGQKFILDSSAQKGDTLKYSIKYGMDGITVTMYNANTYGSKGYVLCYTLEDAILVHSDVAEFYYTFIPDGFSDKLNNVDIKVDIPNVDETLRVWAHGELYGNVSNENNRALRAIVNYVNPGEKVAIRMTFDKNQVSKSTRLTNKSALNEIIEEETKFANIANLKRNKSKYMLILGIIHNLIFIIFIIYSVIKNYLKHDKEYKIDFDMEYYREFPASYGPETLEYLIKRKNTTDSYSASILNMIYKKCLKAEYNEKDKDYILIKDEKYISSLSYLERYIYDFLINEIGNGESVSLKEIKKYGKKESTANEFLKHFENWKHEVKKDSLQYNFYEERNTKLGVMLIIFSILNFLLGNLTYYSLSFVVTFIGIVSSIYILLSNKKSKSGVLEYKKWSAFKKFLIDFGRFDEKELPEIVLWEKYLVYATVLGVADKLVNTMKIKIESFTDNTDTDLFTMNYMLRHDFTSSMNKSISNAYTTSRSVVASSNSSSGTGGGGGFSSGGGGGGGGGGHGF